MVGILVRRAKHEDIDFIINELKDFSEFFESKIPMFNNDLGYIYSQLIIYIDKHLFLMAEIDGKTVGFIAGFIFPHVFNPQILALTEVFWWVRPEHRGTRAGYMLYKEFMKYGEENCDWITFTLEDKSPVKHELLYKNGFKLKEHVFIKEII